jgi:hypothetical protein
MLDPGTTQESSLQLNPRCIPFRADPAAEGRRTELIPASNDRQRICRAVAKLEHRFGVVIRIASSFRARGP